MRSLYLAGALAVFSLQCHAINTHQNLQSEQVIEPSKKSVQFFKSQVSHGRTVGNALTTLLSRYPEKTTEFVSVALTA
jgi:hypothetical protein